MLKKSEHQHKKSFIEGVISITAKKVGYVTCDCLDEDVEIKESLLNTALHKDRVSVFLHPQEKGKRITGEVVKVLERAKTEFVGTLDKVDNMLFLIPDDKKLYTNVIILPSKESDKIEKDDKVLVKLLPWTDPKNNPRGEIIKIIGKKGDHNVEMESIILEKGFESAFSSKVEKEAEKILKDAPQDLIQEIKHRKDMRDTTTFTIDPASAKDFDDALSFKQLDNGDMEIGIHIADVSHYVKISTELDKEAIKRGTSIYLVDRTIAMLPEILSNDLCSLNPNEDKLAFSAIFIISPEGVVKSRWFGETVINSNKRFTYKTAQDVIDAKSGEYSEELLKLHRIGKILKKGRLEKGSIMFGSREVYFELDEKGKPIEVKIKVLLDTNEMIEDFMLLANKEVAEYIYEINKDIKTESDLKPFIYRIHDIPNRDRIEELSVYLKTVGHNLVIKDEGISSKDINILLQKIQGHAEESLIRTAVLRSMSKAIYSTKNIGHFGLAFEHYTHFTSPIRRYPDIMVHRMMKKYLKGEKLTEGEMRKHEKLATHSSQQEIAATDAERTSIRYKYVEYMSEKIGEKFDGMITGVTDWGIYVEVTENKAEGMISLRSLKDDFYTLDAKNYRIVGQKTKKKYSLGDKVKIKLVRTNLEKKIIDFELV